MDPVPIVFYALICAGLAGLLPQRMGRLLRAGLGAATGVAAALALPVLRGALGM